jgi:predicted nuclease with TOPRIM domain
LFEESQSNLKALKIENEMIKEKNNVLKGEYYKLEANIKEDTAGLKAQLVKQIKKINYNRRLRKNNYRIMRPSKMISTMRL